MAYRILIVDDDEDAIAMIRHHLVGADYEVLHALDGIHALTLATRELPDLVISDICMPEFDGFGLLAALRANETTCALPVVFLTVLDDPESVTRATRMGADGYLPKPVLREALLETVAAKLRLREQRLAASETRSDAVRKAQEIATTALNVVRLATVPRQS